MLPFSKPDCNEAEMQQSVAAGLMQVPTSKDPTAERSCDHISTTGTMQDKATEVHIAVNHMYQSHIRFTACMHVWAAGCLIIYSRHEELVTCTLQACNGDTKRFCSRHTDVCVICTRYIHTRVSGHCGRQTVSCPEPLCLQTALLLPCILWTCCTTPASTRHHKRRNIMQGKATLSCKMSVVSRTKWIRK